MDAGSIFLICFVVIFSLLLVGGLQFGHPLKVRYTRRRTSRRPPQRNLQLGSEVAQEQKWSPRTSSKARRHKMLPWKYPSRHQSATLPSNDKSDHAPYPSPASSFISTISQTESSCNVHKTTITDIVKEPRNLYDIISVPPVPKQSLTRRIADIGTQAPPGALLARRSHSLRSKRSARPVALRSSSDYGDNLRTVTQTPSVLNRMRTTSDVATPSPLRQASLADSPVDLVPSIPVHLTIDLKVEKATKPPAIQPPAVIPVLMRNSEDVGHLSKSNQVHIDGAEFKVETSDVAMKTPHKVQQAGWDQYYEFKTVFSPSPSIRKSPPLQIDAVKTPHSQSSLIPQNRNVGLSFTDSLKRLARRVKATPADKEASPSNKITISGPSSYVPNIGSGWSPNEYLTLHNAKSIENPLIEHPAISPQHFKIDRGRKGKDDEEDTDEEDTSMLVSHRLRQLDRRHGYKMPYKEGNARTTPAMSGE